MKYKIRILTPLHIGCGESYSALSYLMDKRKKPPLISVLNEDIIFETLNNYQRSQFVAWVEEQGSPNLFYFFKNILNDTGFKIQNKLREKAVYTMPDYSGGEKLRRINFFIKQSNRPYIPGTEIKGAIRTAVLYGSLMDDKSLFSWLKCRLKDFRNKNQQKIIAVANKKKLTNKERESKGTLAKEMAGIESELQGKILSSKLNDAKYDIFKYLQVGDSELIDPGDKLAVSCAKPFNISGRPFTLFYEYMMPGVLIPLSMLKLGNGNNRRKKFDHMGFNYHQKKIVSGMDTIFNYCHRFSTDLLNEEISYFMSHGKPQLAEELRRISALNSPETPVLRIGKDEGYNSLTVGLAVKKLDRELYENVLIHATKNKSYDSKHGGPMPKTRKIVQWNGQETTSGWVQIVPEFRSDAQTISKKSSDTHPGPKSKLATTADISKLEGKFQVKRSKR